MDTGVLIDVHESNNGWEVRRDGEVVTRSHTREEAAEIKRRLERAEHFFVETKNVGFEVSELDEARFAVEQHRSLGLNTFACRQTERRIQDLAGNN
jgi:hypothetical protein